MPGARKIIIAQMALAHTPTKNARQSRTYYNGSSFIPSRFRPKEFSLVGLAGIFVLACFYFYSHGDDALTPGALQQSETYKLPADVDPAIAKPTPSSPPTALLDGTGPDAPLPSLGSSPAKLATTLTPTSPRAVVIETSMIPNLVPLMLHFGTVLGPHWGVVLYTLAEGWVEPQSPAFQRGLATGHIEVRFLPAGTSLAWSDAVSTFLASPWLWEQLEAIPRVLLFQTDSVLCSRSQSAVEDYFEYDYVGAPIAAQWGHGYNGGLSIRNPKAFLNVTREVDYAASPEKFEDQFFFTELQKRGANLPEPDVARTFAVETIYYETPLGYHQPHAWQGERIADIEEWCPEVKMIVGKRVW